MEKMRIEIPVKEIGFFLPTLWRFIRKEAVLCASGVLALASMCWVTPSLDCLNNIDWRVLALLFCLMLVVAGWRRLGVFYSLGVALTRRVHSLRGLSLVLVGLSFFTSMLITNDVALITFVPFTISLFSGAGNRALIPLVVLETIAANLGSMWTPIGNPQNLYLFSFGGWQVGDFLLWMLPLVFISFCALLVMVLLQPNLLLAPAKPVGETAATLGQVAGKWRFWLYLALFFLCLSTVFRLLPYTWVLVLVLGAVLLWDRELLGAVDYSLLLTFVCFFIFVGNVQQLDSVRQTLSRLLLGRELWLGVAASQLISNVPAAILLSGFTQNHMELLWSVNIGGLGTLIASMASLISYKSYAKADGAQVGRYLLAFSAYNGVLLLLLCGAAYLLRSWMG